jgi:rhodanese-related sulfurtransferase
MTNGAAAGDSHREAQGAKHRSDAPVLPDISPRELAEILARGEDAPPLLIDVREPHEHAYSRIASARLIPLSTLHEAAASLPRDGNVVVYCHHGIRSAHAVEMLRASGVPARNLAGGIDRWSVEVDPSVRRY